MGFTDGSDNAIASVNTIDVSDYKNIFPLLSFANLFNDFLRVIWKAVRLSHMKMWNI
jgi:hypothetical protein